MRLVLHLFILLLLYTGGVRAQHVYIQGEWKNGPGSVFLHYFEDAATANNDGLRSTINPQTGSFKFEFELTHPTILRIEGNAFIVLPGDSVNVTVLEVEGEPKLDFAGRKKLEHSFLIRLLDRIGLSPAYDLPLNESTIETYKTKVTNHFDSSLAFLEDYLSDQSGLFKTIARDFLTLRHYDELIYPVTARMISKEQLPAGYFDRIDYSIFRKTDLLGFRDYILFIANYNRYLYSSALPTSEFYDSAAIAACIESAIGNFQSPVKDDLLLFIFSGVTQLGTSENKSQIDWLYPYLKESFIDEPKRAIQIENCKREFDIVNKALPKEILSQKMITQTGAQVSLAEILASNDVVYLDFWASWCGPCLAEMPFENQLISYFKGKKIKFILFSLDKDTKDWRKGIAKANVAGTHYLIPEGIKSRFVQYLSFTEIPRYVIFDKAGRLISRNAPRPRAILKDKTILDSLME